MTHMRLWGETQPREVVAEFPVVRQADESPEQRRERERKGEPAPVVAYTVVVVR